MGGDGERWADVTDRDVVVEGTAQARHGGTQLVVPERRELRATETEQHLGGLIVDGGVAPRGEGALEVGECLLRGMRRKRGLPCERGVANQLVAAEHRLGLVEVVGELCGMLVGVSAVQRLEGLRDACVEPAPADP